MKTVTVNMDLLDFTSPVSCRDTGQKITIRVHNPRHCPGDVRMEFTGRFSIQLDPDTANALGVALVAAARTAYENLETE